MGGFGTASQGLQVRTLYVDYRAATRTLVKYTEVWTIGAPSVVLAAPPALRTGMWLGLRLEPGTTQHTNLEFAVGSRNMFGPLPLTAAPAFTAPPLPAPGLRTLTTSSLVEGRLRAAFGTSGGRWLGFEIAPFTQPPAPPMAQADKEALFFRWTLTNFNPHRPRAFELVPIVASIPVQNPQDGTDFQDNDLAGVSLLTGNLSDVDYFVTTAQTLL